MISKFKSTAFIILIVLIVSAVTFAPAAAFKMQDAALFQGIHTAEKPKSKIDPQFEDIYLVKAIHDIYNNLDNTISSVEMGKSEAISTLVAQQRQLLADARIDIGLDSNESGPPIYVTDLNSYSLIKNIYKFSFNDTNGNLFFFQFEKKTEKFIFLSINKESNGYTQAQIKDLLKKYIQYLGLTIIDDWVYTDCGYESKKADLKVMRISFSFFEDKETFILQVIPLSLTDYYRYNYVISSAP